MDITYYPDQPAVERAKKADDPLLLLIAFDESRAIVSNIDDALEHSILLKKAGFPQTTIDGYFRVVLNKTGADWTFVCPNDYKTIKDRGKRIETFYNDGIIVISRVASTLGYSVPIEIPSRYRRHFDTLWNGA